MRSEKPNVTAHILNALTQRIYEKDFVFHLPALEEKSWDPLLCDPNINRERLEFLGDSVIGACVSAELFRAFPGKGPGFYTNARSALTANAIFAHILVILNAHNPMDSVKPAGDAFEMLIGALFEECGFDSVRAWVSANFKALFVTAEIAWEEFLMSHPKSKTTRSKGKTKRARAEYKSCTHREHFTGVSRRKGAHSSGGAPPLRSRSLPPTQKPEEYIDLTAMSDSDDEAYLPGSDQCVDSMDVSLEASTTARLAHLEAANCAPPNLRKARSPLLERIADPEDQCTATPFEMLEAITPEHGIIQRISGTSVTAQTVATPRSVLRAMSLRPQGISSPSISTSGNNACADHSSASIKSEIWASASLSLAGGWPETGESSLGSANNPIDIDMY